MSDGPLRVLVVVTALMPNQLRVWERASEIDGIELHVTGSLVRDAADSYTAPLAVPRWGTTHVLPARDPFGRGRMWWNLAGLPDLIDRLRPDVVHVHSELWGRLVTQALRGRAPVVAHGAENIGLDCGGRVESRLRTIVAKRNAVRLAGYVSWNEAGIRIARSAGLPQGAPVGVAPAVVPDPADMIGAASPRPAGGPVRVGFVGRLVPEKGVQWLVAALDGVPDVRLVVIGNGPYEDEIRRQVTRRGVDTVFVGAVEPQQVPALLGGLDVVVVPSLARPGWVEQFGRVVCEAMLVGIPVITSDSGALPEVVGEGGIVVRELDHEGLHAALAALAADPRERARIGARGRAWALARLAPAAAARSIADVWEKVAVSR